MKILADIGRHAEEVLSPRLSACAEKAARYLSDGDLDHVFGLSGASVDEAIAVMWHAVESMHSKAVFIAVESGDRTEDIVKSILPASKETGPFALVVSPDAAADFLDCASLYAKPVVRIWHIKTVLSVSAPSIFDEVAQDELFWRIRRVDILSKAERIFNLPK